MTEPQRAERNAKRFWVSLVVLLLGLQLVIGATAIKLATGHSSAAIIQDYYATALNWDEIQTHRRALQQRNWSLEVIPSDVVDEGGRRLLRVEVQDQQGAAVPGLHLSAQVYHHANGREVETFSLSALEEGGYHALAPMKTSGLWEAEFKFEHDHQRFLVLRTMDLK